MENALPSLHWSEAMELGLAHMDDSHREFVDLLAQARTSDDTALPGAWQALIDHTEAHFADEDAWMRATRHAESNCHSLQHRMILQVMRQGAARAAAGDITPIRLMANELTMWFPQHAQGMDAALAAYLRRVRYDPVTGEIGAPHELPAHELRCCGGGPACSHADSPG